MKKHTLIVALLFATLFACNGSHEEKQEGQTMDSTTVSAATQDTITAAAADSSAYVCACDHKCKTTEECEKNCGEGCGGLH